MIDENRKREMLADVLTGKLSITQMRKVLHSETMIFAMCYTSTLKPALGDIVQLHGIKTNEPPGERITYAEFLKIPALVHLENLNPDALKAP